MSIDRLASVLSVVVGLALVGSRSSCATWDLAVSARLVCKRLAHPSDLFASRRLPQESLSDQPRIELGVGRDAVPTVLDSC